MEFILKSYSARKTPITGVYIYILMNTYLWFKYSGILSLISTRTTIHVQFPIKTEVYLILLQLQLIITVFQLDDEDIHRWFVPKMLLRILTYAERNWNHDSLYRHWIGLWTLLHLYNLIMKWFSSLDHRCNTLD